MKKVEFEGKCYASIKDLCRCLDLNYSMVSNRLNNGCDLETAISKPNRQELIFHNGGWHSKSVLCETAGVSISTLNYRISLGMSIEEALQKEFLCKCEICGKEFASKRPNKKYCSKTCHNRAASGKGAYKTFERVCVVCGETFVTDKGYHSQTCSKHCRNQLARIERNRRYKHLKAIGAFDKSVTLGNVFDKFNGVCVCCGKKLSFDCDCTDNTYPSIDHITPISKGGTHTWNNVQLMCRKCNILKSNEVNEG